MTDPIREAESDFYGAIGIVFVIAIGLLIWWVFGAFKNFGASNPGSVWQGVKSQANDFLWQLKNAKLGGSGSGGVVAGGGPDQLNTGTTIGTGDGTSSAIPGAPPSGLDASGNFDQYADDPAAGNVE